VRIQPFAACVMAAAVSACGGGSDSPSSPTAALSGLTVVALRLETNTTPGQTSATMRVGQSLEVYPVSVNTSGGFGYDSDTAIFSSSNPTVLTAANGGVVLRCQGTHDSCRVIRANAAGSAVVTYTSPRYPGLSATFPVTVNP
jgi:hypothetical protein